MWLLLEWCLNMSINGTNHLYFCYCHIMLWQCFYIVHILCLATPCVQSCGLSTINKVLLDFSFLGIAQGKTTHNRIHEDIFKRFFTGWLPLYWQCQNTERNIKQKNSKVTKWTYWKQQQKRQQQCNNNGNWLMLQKSCTDAKLYLGWCNTFHCEQ